MDDKERRADRYRIDWDSLVPQEELKPDRSLQDLDIPWEQQAEPVVEAEPEVKAEPVVEAEPVVGTEPTVEAEPVVEAEPEVEAEPVVETEPAVEAEPEVEATPEVEAEPVVETEPVVEAEPEVEAEPVQDGAPAKAEPSELPAEENDEKRPAAGEVYIRSRKKGGPVPEELLSFGKEVEAGRSETHPSWDAPPPEEKPAPQEDPAAAEKRQKSRSRFLTGLLIYVAVFLVLAFAVLTVLRRYAVAYERSQITDYLQAYESSMTADPPREACLAALEALRPGTSESEENIRWMKELLGEASFVKLSDRSSAELAVYGIRAREEQIGTVSFRPGEDLGFGRSSWVLADEEYDFSAFTHSLNFTVPEDYSVRVNGVTLGKEYIVERDIPYEMLAECYEHFDGLPHMVRYESGSWLGDAEVEVLNAAGEVQSEDQLRESVYLDNCPEHIRQMAEVFMPEFIDAYVVFTANLYGASYNNFMQLRNYVLGESDLHIRMRQAIESFGYTTTHEAEVVSMQINALTELGDDRYLADVSYSTRITGSSDPVVTDEHIRVVLYEHKDYLLAEALYVV